MRQNAFAAGARLRTLLEGAYIALPRPPSWMWGRGTWKEEWKGLEMERGRKEGDGDSGGSRKKYWGAWPGPLIIWETTTDKRNYYRTNLKRIIIGSDREGLGLGIGLGLGSDRRSEPNTVHLKIGGLGKIWGPVPQHRTATGWRREKGGEGERNF